MSIRTRSKRVARKTLRSFLGAPRGVIDAVTPSRRRIKRRLRTFVGPPKHRSVTRRRRR